jgi:hypothetical protein
MQGKRESPDIRFVSVPKGIPFSGMNQKSLDTTCQLLFQNVGARAGSLIDLKLVYPDETDKGKINGVGDFQPANFPRVIEPYAAEIIQASIMLRGIPNLKTLLAALGDEAKIGVKYRVSTKPTKEAGTGIEERLNYFRLKFEQPLPLTDAS